VDQDPKLNARWLKMHRVATGRTQEETAALAGVPLRTYQEYEQGRCVPSGERLVAILNALGLIKEEVTA
jgi:transcriptional regulator with XRE-family HTH domain